MKRASTTLAVLGAAAISVGCGLSPEQVRAGWQPGILLEHLNLRCVSFSESDSYIVFEYEVPPSLETAAVVGRLKRQIEASQWKPGLAPDDTCYRAMAENANGFTLVCADADPIAGVPWGWSVSVDATTVQVHSGPPAAIAQLVSREAG